MVKRGTPVVKHVILFAPKLGAGEAGSFFADFIKKHQWLGYLGLVTILIIAIQLIIGGLVNLEVLSINENYKFLFSI